MRGKLLLSSALVTLPALMGFAGVAHAQGAAPAAAPAANQDTGNSGLGEIVVTAQKREQRLQDVPVSVTALTAQSLAVNRITNVRDLDSITPNLTIITITAGSSLPQYSMRGVIGLGSAPGADKGIAFYIDGVYVGTAAGSLFDLADIERIEVLKGPQGTLFGRNSTGGAISVTTAGPAGAFHAKQTLTFGNYDQFTTRTHVDTPQWGPFSAAFTYVHNERRGDIRNKGFGTVFNGAANGLSPTLRSAKYLGSVNTEAFSAAAKLEVSPNFVLNYRFDKSHNNFSEAGIGQIGFGAPVPLSATFVFNIYALNAGSGNPLVLNSRRPKAVNNWATVPSKGSAEGHALTANWQLADNLSLKNIVAYRKSSYFAPLNDLYGTGGLLAGPNTPIFTVITLSGGHDHQWSDELQLDYDSSLLHLTTGGFYYDQFNEKGAAGTGFNSISFRTAPNFVLPAPASPSAQSTVTVKSYAVYAHAEVHVLDTVDLVGGARYTDDNKRGVDRTISAITPGNLNYNDSRWTYDAGINFKPTNDVLLYSKYSTGYISGGKLATLIYNPETAKSFEGGIKADWFDRRLRTNLSLFTAKYANLQLAGSGITFGVPAAAQVLVNAGSARAKGFEYEMTVAPVRNVTLGGSLGYLDFKYTSLDPRIVAAGQTIAAQRPKWTGGAYAQYMSDPVFGDARFSLRVDGNYRSQTDGGTDPRFRALTQLPRSFLYNGRIALEHIPFGGFYGTVALWGKNLSNNKLPRLTTGTPFVVAAVYERARTYGVDLTVGF